MEAPMSRAHILFRTLFFLVLLSVTLPETVFGQADPPEADPADVETVDAIIAAVYDVISGPAGEARNWDRWRSLFHPAARLMPVGPDRNDPQPGSLSMNVMTPEDYVTGAGTYLEENGFFEREIGRVEERFGPIVHVFSTYDSKRTADDPEPFARGINSFQLLYDGDRWWVVSVFWTSEGPTLAIPQKYLNKPGG
jgi:hypothetical protein